jgi:two-component system, chemotaxis family, protein-glutamate methylesterase/glutaminase
VIGVILTGALDDGASGLGAIKEAGGLAVVQDPADAEVPGMPSSALQRVDADYIVSIATLGPLIAELTGVPETGAPLAAEVPLETAEEAAPGEEALHSEEQGPPSAFTCPDCHGTLFQINEGGGLRYRCRVGHAYSEEAMLSAQTASTERALWTALRALEERAALLRKLADDGRRRGHGGVAGLFDTRAAAADADARSVHELIVTGHALEPVGHESL